LVYSLSFFAKLNEMGIYATSILKNTIENIPLSENYNVYTIEDRKSLKFISSVISDETETNSKISQISSINIIKMLSLLII